MLTFVLATSLVAQTLPLPPEIQQQVDAVFRDYDQPGSPGCVIGIVRAGEIVYWRGYGYDTDPPHRPLDPDTVFEVGPPSMDLLWSAFGKLAKEYRLSLDEDIRLRLPEMPEYASPIRIRDLLEGRSRLRSFGELFAITLHDPGVEPEEARILEMLGRQKGLSPEPSYEITDTEYFLLSTIVKRATGISLARVVQERFFGPWKMPNTTLGEQENALHGKRQTVYTSLRDLAKSPELFRFVRWNGLAPGRYLLRNGLLIGVCNGPNANASDLIRKVGDLLPQPTRESKLAMLSASGPIRGIRSGPPSPAPLVYIGPASGRFHSSELDIDVVLDKGVLKIQNPNGVMVPYGKLEGTRRCWEQVSVHLVRQDLVRQDNEVIAIVVGTGWTVKDIRFERLPGDPSTHRRQPFQ